jgi:hypothetical protein
MKEAVLLSDRFPRGVVFRLTQERGKVQIRWQWQQKPYKLEAGSVEEAVRAGLEAVKALESQGLV